MLAIKISAAIAGIFLIGFLFGFACCALIAAGKITDLVCEIEHLKKGAIMLTREKLDETARISTNVLAPILKDKTKTIRQLTDEARQKCPFSDTKRRDIYNSLLLRRLHNRTPRTQTLKQEELL